MWYSLWFVEARRDVLHSPRQRQGTYHRAAGRSREAVFSALPVDVCAVGDGENGDRAGRIVYAVHDAVWAAAR